ncbi:hypothetical protein REL12_000400 [Clostridioides difficile]|nr:hypothetical protein [Clostridioides difficile]EGT4001834.1 hypothetical protein [Clostridioides difficile]MBH6909673.1 hypothetical protein [Clostridioides difficile]MBH7982290.1 hypothetical protein [Clostridioides difficile]MBH8031566.1 hypothetical protein [Clostridioides difficile]
MRYKKIGLGVIASVLCLGLLNGCSGYSHDFNSSEEAQKYVSSKLEDKYNEEFTITEVKKYKEEKIGLNWIMVKVSSKEKPSQTATVYARNTGLFEDSYHVYYYSDEIKELANPLFQDKSFIRDYQLEVQGHTTTTKWNGKESEEEYLKKKEYEIESHIYLNEGKTDEEYAEEISCIMQEIIESDLVFNISVYTNDDDLIFYSLPEQHSQPDVEVILEKIADVRRQQETQKNYKEWKKQNQKNENNQD